MLAARLIVLMHVALGCLPSRERKEISAEELLMKLLEEQNRQLTLERDKCIIAQSNSKQSEISAYCDVMWDGVMCWKPVAPGTLVSQPCPQYIIGVPSEEVAIRQCSANGTWNLQDKNQCIPQENATHEIFIGPIEDSVLLMRWVPVLKIVTQVGYSVSLVTLITAFILLSAMKKLRCPRNMLHLNLFLSFIMRSLVSLAIDILFVKGVGLAKDVDVDESGMVNFKPNRNNWECKALITVCNYFNIANYSWIFMEGLYLHNLIFLALFSDTSAITLYVILGWGLPVFFITPWVLARVNFEDTYCWTSHENSNVFLLIRLPLIIFVLLSFALFVNIVRVLLIKMKSTVYLERRKLRYRRWAKSTLVLVPLFGVHYVLFIWMAPSQQLNETLEIICLFCGQLFGSLQGFLVSLLYCLLNSEVRVEFIRKWRSYKHNKDQPKRGSAHSLPVGLHSMLTVTRMYNVGGARGESLSSVSVPQEAARQDIPSVSKSLQDQKVLQPSVTHEIKKNGYFQGDTEQSACMENGFLSSTKSRSQPNDDRRNIALSFNTDETFPTKASVQNGFTTQSNICNRTDEISHNFSPDLSNHGFMYPSHEVSMKQNGITARKDPITENGCHSPTKYTASVDVCSCNQLM